MYNLFLDDIRQPEGAANYMSQHLGFMYRTHKWEIVRSYEEFVKCIEDKGMPLRVSFDHDLADAHYDPATWTEGFKYHEKTGYDCAKYLLENLGDRLLPAWYIHSQNPVGADNIRKLFASFEKHKND